MRLAPVLTLLLLLAPGCLQGQPAALPVPTGPVAEVGAPPGLALEGCDSAEFGIPRPFESSTPYVPPGFVASDLLPSVHLGLTMLACPRVVAGNAVLADVGFLVAWARVRPTNASWGGPSYFVLDAVATHAHAVASLRAAGLDARGGVLTRPESAAWTMRSGDDSYAIAWYAPDSQQVLTRNAVDRSFWSGSGSFRRVDVHQEATGSLLDSHTPARIEVRGPGAFRQAVGDDVVGGLGYPRSDLDWVVPFQPLMFGERSE